VRVWREGREVLRDIREASSGLHPTSKRRTRGFILALLPAVVLLFSASVASANAHHPTRDFAPFSDCPTGNPAVVLCLYARISGGEFILGHRAVPIDKPVTIQAGLIETGRRLNEYALAGAEDGDTLSKATLKVPGGLQGIVSANRTTEMTATAELAVQPSAVTIDLANFVFEEGVTLRLPVKLKLNNPFLGNDCYVGSGSNPVVLSLTSGVTSPLAPNKPIKGRLGEFREPEIGMNAANGSALVDNAFAASAATGCGWPYSSLINTNIGLPSPAGRNTAIMEGKFEIAETTAVEASE